MRTSFARRVRRAKPSTVDAAFAKKEAPHEPQFFGTAADAAFFQPAPAVQRKCDGCAEEEKKREPVAGVKKPVEIKSADEKKEDEKMVQKKASGSPSSTPPHVPQLAGKGVSMSASAQSFFATRMGQDFSGVRIHTDAEAARSAKSLRAQAYTVGGNIVFAEGKYNPETSEGKKLLAHELTHVIQQHGEEVGAVQRAAEPGAEEQEEGLTEMSSHNGVGTEVENQTDNAFCRGHTFHGSATANYSSSFTSADTITTTTGCRGCRGRECITAEGTITSFFRAAPTTRLPRVPRSFNACEREAAQNFIDTTLTDHENDHVAAFNGYVGQEETPYSYTGCRSGLRRHLQRLHNGLEVPRRRAANADSRALDPFRATFPCDCP